MIILQSILFRSYRYFSFYEVGQMPRILTRKEANGPHRCGCSCRHMHRCLHRENPRGETRVSIPFLGTGTELCWEAWPFQHYHQSDMPVIFRQSRGEEHTPKAIITASCHLNLFQSMTQCSYIFLVLMDKLCIDNRFMDRLRWQMENLGQDRPKLSQISSNIRTIHFLLPAAITHTHQQPG